MATDVQVPALGESITEGTLAQWLKKPGDAVAADEPIASLETDKVTVEVPSPVAGVMAEQLVKEGDTVAVDATTNPAGAGETPLPRGDDHAPEPQATQSDSTDTVTTLSPAVRRAVLE